MRDEAMVERARAAMDREFRPGTSVSGAVADFAAAEVASATREWRERCERAECLLAACERERDEARAEVARHRCPAVWERVRIVTDRYVPPNHKGAVVRVVGRTSDNRVVIEGSIGCPIVLDHCEWVDERVAAGLDKPDLRALRDAYTDASAVERAYMDNVTGCSTNDATKAAHALRAALAQAKGGPAHA
jgi:hypothetical protein